jgi:ribosomal protein S18 acetylase RimI-like enzyme
MLQIVIAESGSQLEQIRSLFKEYSSIPGIGVCLQTFDSELASLPGIYAPPEGKLLLAVDEGRAVGCVGIRKFEEGICEMRRLFVRREARGLRAGRKLAKAALEDAIKLNYKKINLETLPELMPEAVSLYKSLGFKTVDSYYGEAKEGAAYMSRDLI